MDYIAILKADLEKGYSKADLEKLIGLPKNNLSGILKGDRKLSKKSELKIEKWQASEKPNPLSEWIKEFGSMQPVTSEHTFFKHDTKEIVKTPTSGKPVTVTIPSSALNDAYKSNQQLITQYEEELTRLGTSQIAKERGKWLTKRIYELKYPKQND